MRYSISLVLAFFLFALVGSSNASRSTIHADIQQNGDKLQNLRKAKWNAANEGYKFVTAVNSGFGDAPRHLWSVRVLNAEVEMATDKNSRIKAYEDHLSRMKDQFKHIKDLPQNEAGAAIAFYRAEAELWVEEAKAK